MLDADEGREPAERLPPQRRVSDARTLKALTHPTRIALIELLGIAGPTTATEAAERVGESPSSCSFHLRQLAKYGLVEEAGGGQGRSRPWRLAFRGLNISSEPGDPASELAALALGRLVRGRMLERFQAWQETQGSYPRAWREAAHESEYLCWVTPEELQELSQRISEVIEPLQHVRGTDPSTRPPGALPVELLVFRYPIAPPVGEA